MSRLAELSSQLSPAELKELEDFAEFLVLKQQRAAVPAAATPARKVQFDGWAGCLAHIDPNKSDKEVIRESWDELLNKHLR